MNPIMRVAFAMLYLLSLANPKIMAQKCASPGRDGNGSISGVVNTYFPGTATISSGVTTLTIGAGQGSGTAITSGDLLLIVQMQGADVQGSNSNVYGDNTASTPATGYLTTNLNAGLYEYAVASNSVAITGGNLLLQNATINGYTVRDNIGGATQGQSRYQVIRVPQYGSVNLTSNITAMHWNGSVGGIIAIDVAGILNFNGFSIDASASGFRGGGGRQFGGAAGGTGTDYVNVSSLNFHGSKGEGFAGTPRYLNNNVSNSLLDNTAEGYPNGSTGRGAPANAGGGSTDANPSANNQNSGGGGGGNGGIGGAGGNSWSSNAAVGGYGGINFAEASTARLVMGGGGGAGDTNDGTGSPVSGFASSGAAGGGIVMLRLGAVAGNGVINVNGDNANNSVLNDGSGGGGAGGSVVLVASSTSGFSNVSIYAQGGTGGNNSGGGASHGPGGGGGGGVIYCNGTVNVASSVAGGANGITSSSPGPAAYGSTGGSAGIFLQNITAPANTIAGFTCIAPPTANNIMAPVENNSYGQTGIPALSASDAYGKITTYTIATIPTSAQGILYLCNSSCSLVSAGQVVLASDIEKLKFDPASTFIGNALFTYTATNANNVTSNTASYTIPVKNEPPIADNILSQVLTNSAGSQLIPSLMASDPDGAVSSYNITSIPVAASQGVLTYCSNGTSPCTVLRTNISGPSSLTVAQASTLGFTPVSSFLGNIRFNYTATDNNSTVSPSASYTIPVKGTASVHVPPYSDNIVNPQLTNTAGTALITNFASHSATGSISTYTVETVPAAVQGTLTFCSNGTEPCTGTVTAVTAGVSLTAAKMATLKFIPSANFAGTATFTYSATDNTGVKSNIANYSIPVIAIPPVANPVTSTPMTNTFAQTSIPALSGYSPGTIASYTIATIPSASSGILYLCNSACNMVTAGQSVATTDIAKFKFDPAATFTGIAAFTYTTTDQLGIVSQPAIYSIPITAAAFPANLPPVSANVTSSSISNTSGQLSIPSLIATDADGTIAGYNIANLPAPTQGLLYLCNPTCSLISAGQSITPADASSLKFAPTPGYRGNAIFNFTATDNYGALSNLATYSLPVSGAFPQTNNVTTTALAATSGQSAIASLSAIEAGGTISSFTISNLPPTGSGTLSLCKPACTLVTVGQVIDAADAANLKFTPSITFAGLYTQFNYTSTDVGGMLGNVATFTIPLTVNNVTLPIHLISFTADKITSGVQLKWNTDMEFNVNSYEIERSEDGQQFDKIGVLFSNSNANTNTYHYFDGLPGYKNNIVYYRLKMIDNDGKFTFSTMLIVNLGGNLKNSLVVSPNPVIDHIIVRIYSTSAVIADIQIVTAVGQLLYQQKSALVKGINSVALKDGYAIQYHGTYFIKATVGTDVLTSKFVKQRN